MSRCRLIFFCALLCCGRAEATTAVWIDTDPAIGAPWREVDDAFALLLVFHSPEVKIVGLSTTYGNAALPRTTAVARDLVQRFGQRAGLREDMVHPGARSPRDRTAKTEATEGLASALREHRLTYIALGPLTNLAAFLALHPDLADRIDRIILVGGRTPETRFAFGPNKSFRVHDANVFKDPAAVA
ncbi:MAG: nucleoside hydrolase, partial [Chthoniobacterales bacterium]